MNQVDYGKHLYSDAMIKPTAHELDLEMQNYDLVLKAYNKLDNVRQCYR